MTHGFKRGDLITLARRSTRNGGALIPVVVRVAHVDTGGGNVVCHEVVFHPLCRDRFYPFGQ